MCSSQNFRRIALQALQKSTNHDLFLFRFSFPSSFCFLLLKEIQTNLNMKTIVSFRRFPWLYSKITTHCVEKKQVPNIGLSSNSNRYRQKLIEVPGPIVMFFIELDLKLRYESYIHMHRHLSGGGSSGGGHDIMQFLFSLPIVELPLLPPDVLPYLLFDSPKMDLSGAHILSKLMPNSVKSIGGGCAGLCTPGTPPFSRFWPNIKQSNSSFLCRSCESIKLPALLYHGEEEMADPIMNIYKCNRKSIDQWHASAGRHETSDPDRLQSHRRNSHNIQQTWYRNISGNKAYHRA
uniref:Uncharacterized protein n=1 Tax=Glossina austeni TaxID=7395 RepID=A0A1A9V0B6_GLOAU